MESSFTFFLLVHIIYKKKFSSFLQIRGTGVLINVTKSLNRISGQEKSSMVRSLLIPTTKSNASLQINISNEVPKISSY